MLLQGVAGNTIQNTKALRLSRCPFFFCINQMNTTIAIYRIAGNFHGD